MAASRRASPAAAGPPAVRRTTRAPGRRRRPSLWRRALRALPRPVRARQARSDELLALRHEISELRLAVAALRAEVASVHETAAAPVPAPEPVQIPAPAAPVPDVVLVDPALLASATSDRAGVTIVLPLARAARAAGVPAEDVVAVDTGADTAVTEIVLEPAGAEASPALPEEPLLDPRLARVAEALDGLLADAEPERPVAATRESA